MNTTIDMPAQQPGALVPATMREDTLMHTVGPLPIAKHDAKENRVVNVNEALQPAYQKASTLQLTEDERKAITEPFPDECVERRPHDGLLYIPHIEISDRLCQVFGPGQWCTVRRREWVEGTRIYAEWVLLIRGCFIGESVGAMDYHPNNPKMNYSDALEGTRGECIRRIAAKELGCGSQVWRPSYCRAWEARNPRGGRRAAPEPSKPAAKPSSSPAKASGGGKPFKTKEQLIKLLGANVDAAVAVLRREGILNEDEGLDKWPDDALPNSPEQLNTLLADIREWSDGQQQDSGVDHKGFPKDESEAPQGDLDEAWKSHKFHFGPAKGKTLGEYASADSKKFYGWVMNYNPSVDRDGNPKNPSPEDMALRDALDEAKIYMEGRK